MRRVQFLAICSTPLVDSAAQLEMSSLVIDWHDDDSTAKSASASFLQPAKLRSVRFGHERASAFVVAPVSSAQPLSLRMRRLFFAPNATARTPASRTWRQPYMFSSWRLWQRLPISRRAASPNSPTRLQSATLRRTRFVHVFASAARPASETWAHPSRYSSVNFQHPPARVCSATSSTWLQSLNQRRSRFWQRFAMERRPMLVMDEQLLRFSSVRSVQKRAMAQSPTSFTSWQSRRFSFFMSGFILQISCTMAFVMGWPVSRECRSRSMSSRTLPSSSVRKFRRNERSVFRARGESRSSIVRLSEPSFFTFFFFARGGDAMSEKLTI
mmetsp:Transcript_12785/g.38359  ORF Transcript_12785/g.38359 Transcript_12785/m.38359 type:complete len:327 (-) Transcript_12785:526-1506(-)